MRKNRWHPPTVQLKYNRYRKASATQDAVIEIVITFNRRRKFLSTYLRVFPNQWSEKQQQVINRLDAQELNRQLGIMVLNVRKILSEMMEEGSIDIWAIPDRLNRKQAGNITFLDFIAKRAEVRKYGRRDDTQKRYDRFIRFFREWGKITSFSDITDAKVKDFDEWLKKRKLQACSRFHNYHRFLEMFIRDAIDEGYVRRNPYKWVHVERGEASKALEKCLTPAELTQLRTAEMPNDRLERIRDLFVFHCFTCFSYRDLRAFNPKKIKEVDGKKIYQANRQKTSVTYSIPMLPPALEILEKYKNKLPVISNIKYNAYLKEVAAAAGIAKPLTTHWARHTGATLLLNAGVDLKIVSKILGHSSTRMTEQVYAKLIDETIVRSVGEVEDKIIK